MVRVTQFRRRFCGKASKFQGIYGQQQKEDSGRVGANTKLTIWQSFDGSIGFFSSIFLEAELMKFHGDFVMFSSFVK